MMYIVVNINQ